MNNEYTDNYVYLAENFIDDAKMLLMMRMSHKKHIDNFYVTSKWIAENVPARKANINKVI